MKGKRKQGYALMLVLVVVVILSILSMGLFFMTDANTKQVAVQEDNLRAYYLARSGIDLAYAALMVDDGGIPKLKTFIAEGTTVLTDTLELPNATEAEGTVTIRVAMEGTEVHFQASAKMKSDNGTYTLNYYVDQDDFTKTRWGR